MFTISKRVMARIVITAFAISVALSATHKLAVAHNPTAFLSSPYYGNAGRNQNFNPPHNGIDFALAWAPILAAANGSVDFVGWQNMACHDEDDPGCTPLQAGFGLYVRIDHGPAGHAYKTYYAHLSVARRNLGAVSRNQWIGTSGDSGNSTGPHLHFEVRHADVAVNPDNEGGVRLWTDGEWVVDANPARPLPTLSTYGAEIIVDDTPDNTGGFTKGRGATIACPPDPNCTQWNRVTTTGYAGDMYWKNDNDNTVDYWAQWRPSLPQTANYQVFAYIPCTNATSWQVPYTVNNGSSGVLVVIDQLTLCNQWIGLGFMSSPAGASAYVKVDDATGEAGVVRRIGVDAVKFVRVNVGPFENENYRVNNSPRSGHSWTFANGVGGFGGSGYMEATPNDGANLGDLSGPELQYRVAFPTAGTYYAWIRGRGGPTNGTVNTNDDSLWFGLNGGLVERMAGWENGTAWLWKNRRGYNDATRITVNVPTPGLHTVNIWMREDGLRIDRVLFSQDASHTPQ